MQDVKTRERLDTVLELESIRQQAMLDRDMPLLRELFAEDAIYTHSSGNVHDKEGYLGALAAGEFLYRSIEIRDRHCQVLEDAIVITGYSTHDVVFLSGPRKLEARFLSVWIRERNTWRHVAWQTTPLDQPFAVPD
jgi:hypothetical protein